MSTQEVVKTIEFTKLKNLKDFRLNIPEKKITVIMGANCSGKTTILHALACIYAPKTTDQTNYRFPFFFTPNTDSLWSNSEFVVHFSQREGENTETFQKTYQKHRERWSPKYERRPKRNVKYIGCSEEAIPEIEKQSKKSMIKYIRKNLLPSQFCKLKELASYILSKSYDCIDNVDYVNTSTSSNLWVQTPEGNYTTLFMSAGEQRIFKILETIIACEDYSLILIDEIDLFLHHSALKRLLEKLSFIVTQKKLQLVCTSHFQGIYESIHLVNVVNIHQTCGKTILLEGMHSDAIYYLTGTQPKDFQVFVEDDLAKSIISKLLAKLGLKRRTSIECFGAANNVVTIACAFALQNDNMNNKLFILDGDVMIKRIDVMNAVKKVLSGTSDADKNRRILVFKKIRRFILPQGNTPEQYIRNSILGIQEDNVPQHLKEIYNVIKEQPYETDTHDYITHIKDRLDIDKNICLANIAELFSLKEDEWDKFTIIVKKFFNLRTR